jgi:hypothetical protein
MNNKKDEKEYIEPEVLRDSSEKKQEDDGFSKEDFSDIKKKVLLKGVVVLIPYILVTILVLALIFWAIFALITTPPFSYLFAALFVYFLANWFLKNFKK